MPWLCKRFEERISPADEGYFRERMSKIVYGAQEILCDADGEIFCFGVGPFVFPGDLGFLDVTRKGWRRRGESTAHPGRSASLIVENSCKIPSILTEMNAVPGSELNSILRKLLFLNTRQGRKNQIYTLNR